MGLRTSVESIAPTLGLLSVTKGGMTNRHNFSGRIPFASERPGLCEILERTDGQLGRRLQWYRGLRASVRIVAECVLQVAALLLSYVSVCAAADVGTTKIREDVVGHWLVDIQGEARSRTLNVMGVEGVRPGEFALEATYGWSDARQTPIKASLSVKPEGYRLVLTTQADSVLDAGSTGATTFIGTFRWKNGKEQPAKLERVSKEKLDGLVDLARVFRLP